MSNGVIETDGGRVRGNREAGVSEFLGIPYARPPVGPLRFAPPVRPEPWSGVRSALAYPPSSVQYPTPVRAGPLAGVLGPSTDPGMSEDCLALNVWTADPGGRAPVMVWFHGGGYTAGSGSSTASHGAALARRREVVVVTVNHRLGLLGFLDVSEHLGPDYQGSANAGLLDLVAALEWVRTNIAAFGGDPGRVTIFGESGGGGKVCSLLTMPAASGLFGRAIVQSGPTFSLRNRELSQRVTQRVLELTGAEPGELAGVPAQRLLDAQVALGAAGGPSEGGMAFAPTLDTAELPADPEAAFAAGVSGDVPLLIGTNRDEARFALAIRPELGQRRKLGDDELAHLVSPGFDGDPGAIIARYRELRPGISNFDLRYVIESEQFRVRTLRIADAKAGGGIAPVFCYRMDWFSPALPDCGAFHALEVPLMFANTASAPILATDEGAIEISRTMSEAWATFAASGTPAWAGGPAWAAYNPPRRFTMIIDCTWQLEEDPLADERRAWETETLSRSTRPWGRLLVPAGAPVG